ncbi:type I restriction enzyme, S subunit [Thermomonospora echinospora]|uniref:Type I restriction enzyme, S subunit n=1 Tax=Thermomonospora echinospora TaxID=1992 RepID=A0A1H5YJR9_9ACTN|nr:restriction endonuclease subunit S [Thermomonospora echinospora]SEG24234.1 type I restriction enzyme, S subunit [Thermomonospora echinospora]
MTNLPSGWIRLPLCELGTWYGGGTPSKSNPEFWDDGTVPWLSPKDMNADVISGTRDHITEVAVQNSPVRVVPENSVAVVVRSGILERKVPIGLVSFAVTLNQDMKAISPGPWLDARWLSWGLRSLEKYILRNCRKSGTTVASIETKRLMDLKFPVPPLAEQRRIVAALEDHLSHLDAATAGCSTAGARIPLLRRSALQALRQRALQCKAELLPLGTIATTSLGKMLDSKRNEGEPTPYLRNINVRWGSFDLANIETVPMPEEQRTKFSLREGDLLVCEGGEPGRCAIWPGGYELMTYQKALHRIRPGDRITSEWLALMIEESIRNGRAVGMFTGTTIKHLPQEKLRMLNIPVPSREVQEDLLADFAETAQTVERFSNALATSEHKSEHLRRALLAEAFAGRLVEQDPADEPASVLLERIRAERAAGQPVRRARRGKGEKAPQKETLL